MNWKAKMADIIWRKQALDTPLFPDLLWSRPENRQNSGKLTVIGGNVHGFSAPALAYAGAEKTGVGACRVVLPDKLAKIVGNSLQAFFAPSTPSGSFSRRSLAIMLESARWADGALLAGDFGRNSETAIALESLSGEYTGQLTLAGDAVDYFIAATGLLLSRDNTLLIINLGQLQKLAKHNRPSTPVFHNMNLQELIFVLADWTSGTKAGFVTKHADRLILAMGGQVSTTPHDKPAEWQVEIGAYAAVWWLQQPSRAFEAITTAIYSYCAQK